MKAYTQLIKKPLSKKEVRQAVTITLSTGYVDAVLLSQKMKIGFSKASQLAKLMYDSGIVVDNTMRGTAVILKDAAQAINAAFRQLRKEGK